MNTFSFEEMNLMCIYNTGSRKDLISNLEEMRPHLDDDEMELKELTDSTLEKLRTMSDEEFDALELYPDFDE